jgi:hypothetical protein
MSKAAAPEKSAVVAEKADFADVNSANVVETTITVHRTVKLDGTDVDSASTQEKMKVHAFATVPAMVGVNLPIKISRNFQSVGLEVLVQIPCYKEEVREGIEYAYKLAKERVMQEIPEIQKALAGIVDGAHNTTPTP